MVLSIRFAWCCPSALSGAFTVAMERLAHCWRLERVSLLLTTHHHQLSQQRWFCSSFCHLKSFLGQLGQGIRGIGTIQGDDEMTSGDSAAMVAAHVQAVDILFKLSNTQLLLFKHCSSMLLAGVIKHSLSHVWKKRLQNCAIDLQIFST
jgi:hypothetical protein